MSGSLFVVGVPIGNLEDITLRALRVLRSVPVIACEDTRQTGKLLTLLEIARPQLVSLHDHNEAQRIAPLLERLAGGEDVALVSDAGTPAISDPGFRLVRAAVEAGVAVVPVPGPSAVVAALCAAGLPTDQFRFVGFVPPKAEGRRRALEALASAGETLVFYESPHRVAAFLEAAVAAFGPSRPAVIARELTKRFEEFRRGSLAALAEDPGVLRGEVVLLVGGAAPAAVEASDLAGVVGRLLGEGLSPSRAAKEAAALTGASKREAYALALSLSGGVAPGAGESSAG